MDSTLWSEQADRRDHISLIFHVHLIGREWQDFDMYSYGTPSCLSVLPLSSSQDGATVQV